MVFPYLRENSITMLKNILSPLIKTITPHVAHVNVAGGGGGSRPAKEALKNVAAAKKRREAIAKAKKEKMKIDFARRQQTKALGTSR